MIPATQAHQGLWRLVVPPSIWATHFIASYATVSVWCSKVAVHGGSFWQVQTIIAAYGIVALAGLGFTAWIGYRECARGGDAQSQDTIEGRYRFVGYATLLLSALSGIATA